MIIMTDQNGIVLAKKQQAGNNFKKTGDKTLKCKGTGGWDEGYWNQGLTTEIDSSVTQVTVKITNTLNQGNKDESIGYGDMVFSVNDGKMRNFDNNAKQCCYRSFQFYDSKVCGCNPETEWTCANGDCIANTGFCDGTAQCTDGSDEGNDKCCF
jgi:hypothetical protein